MDYRSENKSLIYTERCSEWLKQFEYGDKECASKFVRCLTLVSHNEFERNILCAVEKLIGDSNGTVALYPIREVEPNKSYFEQSENIKNGRTFQDALNRGSDHGSEAIVASLIRGVCRRFIGKAFNCPTLAEMRGHECREIIFIDDFVGSGDRCVKYINSFLLDKSILSWLSYKYLKIKVILYSGTELGINKVLKHKSKPDVVFYRHCPTIDSMPWAKSQKKAVVDICYKYGRYSHKNNKMCLGYHEAKAMLVFEHGCPNNVPSILWGSVGGKWCSLFPYRSVAASEGSIFPSEIVRGDPVSLLLLAGQERLAKSCALSYAGEDGANILLILALLAKRQHNNATLSYAMSLNREDCEKLVERCIEMGLISQTRRLTDKGYKELQAARKMRIYHDVRLDIGQDYYYPTKLRSATYG